jgi:hypothetical protein
MELDLTEVARRVLTEDRYCGVGLSYDLSFPRVDLAVIACDGRTKVGLVMIVPTLVLVPAVVVTVVMLLGLRLPAHIALCGAGVGLLLGAFAAIRYVPRAWKYYSPLVLDQGTARMFRQRGGDLVLGKDVLGTDAALKDIGAIQICSKQVPPRDGWGEFTFYEANIVMLRPAGARITVMTGSRPAVLDDARRIAAFLRVPLLDHTERRMRPGSG